MKSENTTTTPTIQKELWKNKSAGGVAAGASVKSTI